MNGNWIHDLLFHTKGKTTVLQMHNLKFMKAETLVLITGIGKVPDLRFWIEGFHLQKTHLKQLSQNKYRDFQSLCSESISYIPCDMSWEAVSSKSKANQNLFLYNLC